MLLLLLPSSCYQQSSSAIILNVLSYGLIIDHGSLSARPHQQQPWWRPVSAAAATRSRPSERRKRESRAAKNGNTVFSDDFFSVEPAPYPLHTRPSRRLRCARAQTRAFANHLRTA